MTTQSLSPARLWRSHPRELVALGALALAAIVAAAGSAWSNPNIDAISAARQEHAAPAPPPMIVRNLSPTDALAINGKVPVSSGPQLRVMSPDWPFEP